MSIINKKTIIELQRLLPILLTGPCIVACKNNVTRYPSAVVFCFIFQNHSTLFLYLFLFRFDFFFIIIIIILHTNVFLCIDIFFYYLDFFCRQKKSKTLQDFIISTR